MHLILQAGKKITINVGRNFRQDFCKRNKSNSTGFTLIELIATLGIICLLISVSTYSAQKYFYRHKAKLIEKKLQHVLNLAQQTALITKRAVSVCAYDTKLLQCSDDWHNSIIVFYSANNNNLLPKSELKAEKIIFRLGTFINSNETLNIQNFSNQPAITYDYNSLNFSAPINTSISYHNVYYNLDIKINKIGRSNFQLSSL